MTKTTFVQQLEEGESFADLLMVKSCRMGETRAGKPYLSLTLCDKTGEISGPVWENAEALQSLCEPGNILRIQGQVQTYLDKLQLRIEHIEAVLEGTYRIQDFLTSSSREPDTMQDELKNVIQGISNRFIKQLLNQIFFKSRHGDVFQHAPAAKGIHHAYIGGLLEHSLSMARVAGMLATHYREIDYDLLIAGALLHDIGKIEELQSQTGVIDYTDSGRLKGHLVIGCELVGREAESIDGFPAELLTQLQHLILSHHGRLEFGSPVVPMTVEAMLLCFIDDMDSKMNQIEQLRQKLKSGTMQWSDYQRSLERFLFLRPYQESLEENSQSEEKDQPISKQPTLF